jgi:hypothetical protein
MENQTTPPAPNAKAGQNMGVAALILGIIAVILAFIPCTFMFAGIPCLLAIIFGAVGMSQAKKGGAKRTLPMAGLILGIISAVFVAVYSYIAFEAVMGVKSAMEQDSTFMQGLDSAFMQMDSVMQEADTTANQ